MTTHAEQFATTPLKTCHSSLEMRNIAIMRSAMTDAKTSLRLMSQSVLKSLWIAPNLVAMTQLTSASRHAYKKKPLKNLNTVRVSARGQ